MLKWIVVAALTFAAVLLFMGATASPEEQAQELTEINLKQLLKDPDSMKIKSSFIVKNPADKNGNFDYFKIGYDAEIIGEIKQFIEMQ